MLAWSRAWSVLVVPEVGRSRASSESSPGHLFQVLILHPNRVALRCDALKPDLAAAWNIALCCIAMSWHAMVRSPKPPRRRIVACCVELLMMAPGTFQSGRHAKRCFFFLLFLKSVSRGCADLHSARAEDTASTLKRPVGARWGSKSVKLQNIEG